MKKAFREHHSNLNANIMLSIKRRMTLVLQRSQNVNESTSRYKMDVTETFNKKCHVSLALRCEWNVLYLTLLNRRHCNGGHN